MAMDKMQIELAKVIERYFGADAGYLDISCFDLAKRIIEAGWTKPAQEPFKDCHWATEQAYKNGYADGQPKWIPVTERLPEEYKAVFVCYESGKVYINYTTRGGKWHCIGDDITHWMPLPEPPKGE